MTKMMKVLLSIIILVEIQNIQMIKFLNSFYLQGHMMNRTIVKVLLSTCITELGTVASGMLRSVETQRRKMKMMIVVTTKNRSIIPTLEKERLKNLDEQWQRES